MTNSMYDIIEGDCIAGMRTLPDACVQTCITSPPYFGLRDYGVDGQIGLEPTPDEFVAKLVAVFREVRRVLRDDGTLWLNLGDSYGATGGDTFIRGSASRRSSNPESTKSAKIAACASSAGSRTDVNTGLRPKNILGIPWRVAFALQADGWCLRQDIIWHKPNPMPESVTDRCTKAHEYIFLLAKSELYYYDHEAVKEPATKAPDRRLSSNRYEGDDPRVAAKQGIASARCKDYRETGRNRRSVWTVSTKPFKGAHFATFPPDLIEPCVMAGAPVGGLVLDPFTGSGTTGMVAVKRGRRFVGTELNPEYAAMARGRIDSQLQEAALFAGTI